MMGAFFGFIICLGFYEFDQLDSLWMLWGGLIGFVLELLIRLWGSDNFFAALDGCFSILDIFGFLPDD